MGDVTLPNMGLVQVSNGGSSGTWGTKTNDNTAKLDVHDHTPGLGARIPVLGININDDLSFGGTFAPIHLHHVSFDQIAVSPGAGSFYVSSDDHNLYFKSIGLAEIKITNGSSLNVAAFTGGFIGDVTLMKPEYDNGVNQYKFADLTNKRAVIQCGSVQLVEFNAVTSTAVTLQSPAALAGSYTMQMPAALPAATSLVQMSAAGVLTASNTLAANRSIKVSGTGAFKHDTETISIPIQFPVAGGVSPDVSITTGYIVPIALLVGRRIIVIRAVIKDNVTSTLHVSLGSAVATAAGGAFTNVGSSAASAGTGAVQTLSLTGLTTVVIAGSVYAAMVLFTTGIATCHIYAIEVDYDYP